MQSAVRVLQRPTIPGMSRISGNDTKFDICLVLAVDVDYIL